VNTERAERESRSRNRPWCSATGTHAHATYARHTPHLYPILIVW